MEARRDDAVLAAGRPGWAMRLDLTWGPMRVGHRHEAWEVNLVTRGTASYVIDGRRVELRRDSLLWLLPTQGHLLIDRSPGMVLWLAVFSPRLLRTLRVPAWGGWLGGETAPPLVREVGEPVSRYLAGMFDALSAGLPGPHERAGLAFLAAECWRAWEAAPDRPAGSHLHPAVAAAVDALAEHPAQGDLDALADRVHLSRPHLSRLFREQVGLSITDFRNRQRVRRLRELVGRGGARSLTEAAYAAGFGSYAQCYRVVRDVTGDPPNALVREG